MAKIKVLWKAPNVAIAQRGPRYLEYLNREGKTEFYAPEMDAEGNIVYEVDEEYGRRLLAGQQDRFFLISPASLVIKRRRKDGMGAEYATIKAIGSATAAAKSAGQADRSGAAHGPDGTHALSQVPETTEEAATGAETAILPRETGEDHPAAGVATPQTDKHSQKKDGNEHKGNRPKATGA